MSLIMTKDKYSEIHIGEIIIKSGDCEKQLVVKINSELHFWWSYKKANRKLRALVPATP